MTTVIVVYLLLFVFVIEFFSFRAFKLLFSNKKIFLTLYILFSVAIFLYVIFSVFSLKEPKDHITIQKIVFLSILTLVPKAVIGAGIFINDLLDFGSYFLSNSQQSNSGLSRRKFITTLSLGIASIPFFGILHGVFFGRYNYRIIKKTLFFDDLPSNFDGFKIVQISDIHSGSFDNKEKVEYGISLVNKVNADIVLFTGDLVNELGSEMRPWIKSFKKITAKTGKFSVLGNHDYGKYTKWGNKEAAEKNFEEVQLNHKKIGFNLLKNQNHTIERDGESISILGVENWGLPPFPQYGDLDKALKGVREDAFCVLMSHDPTHFDEKVVSHKKNIHLTLSGHTHGMQFGIEIPGFLKWSPASFKYPKWAGLYESMGQYLYVNRGFGYIAFPGRVGIWPEITEIVLKRKT